MSVDVSTCLVCSEPNIWVFDNLLSKKFLDHIDNLFEHGVTHEFQQVEGGKKRNSRSVQIEVNEDTQELLDAIRTVSKINEVEPCRRILISDVWGDIQDPHTDHISLKDLELRYEKLSFLDLCKQSASPYNPSKVVPTFSIVVYFNDVGGIRFPNAPALTSDVIAAKRGRIVMFQNFLDSQRPSADPRATHYGFYFSNVPRRLMTMGILANETSRIGEVLPTCNIKLTPGLIYCAGVRDEGIRHDWMPTHHHDPPTTEPPKPKPPPKRDMLLSLEVSRDGDDWVTTVFNMGGEEVCVLRSEPTLTIDGLRKAIKEEADRDDKANVELVLPDGTMVLRGNNDVSIQHLFGTRGSTTALLSLEPDATTKAKKIFDEWDKDGNGVLSMDELALALRALDPSLTDEQLYSVFQRMDANENGLLEWIEFLEYIFSDKPLLASA